MDCCCCFDQGVTWRDVLNVNVAKIMYNKVNYFANFGFKLLPSHAPKKKSLTHEYLFSVNYRVCVFTFIFV